MLVAPDPAGDVALDAAKISPDLAQRLVRPLELLGVGVALMGDERVLTDTRIGLAQADAVFLGEPHETFARAMHQLGVGGKGEKSDGFAAPVRVATERLS
jgi:hypothetical protein